MLVALRRLGLGIVLITLVSLVLLLSDRPRHGTETRKVWKVHILKMVSSLDSDDVERGMDAREGGGYRMSFTNFSTGKSHSFGGKYIELLPHERIKYTDEFEDPNLPGKMQVTITLRKVSCGTELEIVQEGLPSVIPVEACYVGWQESLSMLANLVEAEIPD